MLALLGLNQLWPKIILIGGIVLLVTAGLATVFMQGKKAAQVDAVVAAMKSLTQAQKQRAKIEAMKSADARAKLKERWSRQ